MRLDVLNCYNEQIVTVENLRGKDNYPASRGC